MDSFGHIVFDCDGTLISGTAYLKQIVTKVFTDHLNRPINSVEMDEKFNRDPNVLFSNFDIDDHIVKNKLLSAFNSESLKSEFHYALFDGIKELITELSKTYQLYVWTGRDRHSTSAILNKLDILKYFDDIRCADDCAPKPSPDGLHELLDGQSKAKCMVIGDSYTDIIGGKKYGIYSIGATWDHHANEHELTQMGADSICSSIAELKLEIKKYYTAGKGKENHV